MALIIEKPQKSGVVAKYWRLNDWYVDRQIGRRRLVMTFFGYLDEPVREAGKACVTSFTHESDVSDPSYPDGWTLSDYYAYALANEPFFAGAISDGERPGKPEPAKPIAAEPSPYIDRDERPDAVEEVVGPLEALKAKIDAVRAGTQDLTPDELLQMYRDDPPGAAAKLEDAVRALKGEARRKLSELL